MLLYQIVYYLPPRLRPFAKAVVPAVAAVLAALVHGLVTGGIRSVELEVAIMGLVAAAVAYSVGNAPSGLLAYAKAILPALVTVIAVIVHWAVWGAWDADQWAIALSGLGAALVTLLLPNTPVAEPHDPSSSTVGLDDALVSPDEARAMGLEGSPAVHHVDAPLLPDEDPVQLEQARERAAAENPPVVGETPEESR